MKQLENIKNLLAQASQILKIKNKVKSSKFFNFLFAVFIFAFLFLNFASSQFISPVYFKFVNNDNASAISFLQKIKTLPEYSRILEMNNNIYGNTIKNEILKKENEKKEVINNLEQQLGINPRSRDVLYSLYRLYLEEGNNDKAREYLKRAKEIDPTIK
jgi:tetratricopeptide (TPR) repeat protein